MTITTAICNSWKTEIMRALHDFTLTTGHVIKVALYGTTATLNKTTTVYTPTGEIVGPGYVAGGDTLVNVTPVLDGDTAVADWDNPKWLNTTLTDVRGYMIYNSSSGNRAIKVEDFGASYSTVGQDFEIILPPALSGSAAVRIS